MTQARSEGASPSKHAATLTAPESIQAVVARVRARGATLWVEGGQLRYRAAPGVMTPQLAALLGSRRDELVAALSSPATGGAQQQQLAPARKPSFERRKRRPHETVPILQYHDVRWASVKSGKLGVQFVNSAHRVLELRGGAVNVEALRCALRLLQARHPTLTARVIETAAGPQLAFDARRDPPLQVLDLSQTDAADRLSAARTLAGELVWRPFDSPEEAWLRVFVIRLADDHHVLGLVIHHFIADGWSIGIALNELLGAHAALALGQSPRFPDLPIDYCDYADGVNRWIQSGGAEANAAYWRDELRGVVPTRLVPDFEVDPDTRGDGATETFQVDVDVMRRVQRWAQARKVTLHSVILAALALAVRHQAKQDDVVIVTRTSGRFFPEVRGVIGAFFDGMAIRIELSDGLSFEDLVRQVQATFARGSAHQPYPLQLVKAAVEEAGDSEVAPMINLLEAPLHVPESVPSASRIEPLALPARPAGAQPAKTDTSFYLPLRLDHEGLRGSLDYLPLMYRRATIVDFLATFVGAVVKLGSSLEAPEG